MRGISRFPLKRRAPEEASQASAAGPSGQIQTAGKLPKFILLQFFPGKCQAVRLVQNYRLGQQLGNTDRIRRRLIVVCVYSLRIKPAQRSVILIFIQIQIFGLPDQLPGIIFIIGVSVTRYRMPNRTAKTSSPSICR